MTMRSPKPREMAEIFAHHHDGFGVVSVAYGSKITGGNTLRDTPSIAFFVRRKIDKLKSSRSWKGVNALPAQLTLDAGTVVTDVVEIDTDTAPPTGTRTNKPQAVPGDEVSYQGQSGSMACLVQDHATGETLALTNHHVAPDIGRRAKFRHAGVGLIAMPVSRTLLHLADELFMPFVHNPDDQLRVDASLIGLRDDQLDRFSNIAPHFGAIGQPFVPNYNSLEEYRRSVDQLPVYSYSFNTKRRFGIVTHVYEVLDDPVGGTLAKACMLIMGRDGVAPSASKDSGKLWMTKVDGENRPVGLHFGRQEHQGTKLAAASDFGAICKFWNLTVV